MISFRNAIRIPSFLHAHMSKGLGEPFSLRKLPNSPSDTFLLLGMIQIFSSLR
jgi:hypothetical protein